MHCFQFLLQITIVPTRISMWCLLFSLTVPCIPHTKHCNLAPEGSLTESLDWFVFSFKVTEHIYFHIFHREAINKTKK